MSVTVLVYNLANVCTLWRIPCFCRLLNDLFVISTLLMYSDYCDVRGEMDFNDLLPHTQEGIYICQICL